MIEKSAADGPRFSIGQTELLGRRFQDPAQRSVVDVTNARKHVVDDVQIQAAEEPCGDRIAASVVERGVEDMANAIVGDMPFPIGLGKRRPLIEVIRLEDQCERKTAVEMHDREPGEDRIPRCLHIEQRHHQHVGVVKRLAGEENGQLARWMLGDFLVAKALMKKSPVVLREHPIQSAETVEERCVQMLIAMKRPSRIMRGEPEEISGDQRGVGSANVDE